MRYCPTYKRREPSWFVVRIGMKVKRKLKDEETVEIKDFKTAKRMYSTNVNYVLYKDNL